MQEIRVYFQQDIYSVTLVWRNSDADDDAIVVVLMRGWRHFEMSESFATISSISWRFTFFQTLWWWGVKQMGVNMKSFLQKNLLTKARVSWQIQNIFRHQTNKHSRSRYEWTSSYFGVFCGVAQVLQCRSVPERILSNSQQSQIIAQSSVESGS